MEHINKEQVKKHSEYEDLIEIIESAFIAYDNGNVEMPDKSYIYVEEHNGDFRSMPAYINAKNWESSGVKWVNVHPDNEDLKTVMGTVIYTDPSTGQPLAVMDGTEITKRRTAVASAIATDNLAKDDIDTVGILGLGVQAYEQIRAIEKVREFNNIYISDIDQDAIKRFKKEFNDDYNVQSVKPNRLTDADVLCTLTPSTEPIIDEINNKNIHINAIGADAPKKQELDPSLIKSKNTSIIVDNYSQAMHSGEISKLVDNNEISKDDIFANLGEIVNKTVDKNNIDSDITVFDSTGLAIQDMATAYLIYNSIS